MEAIALILITWLFLMIVFAGVGSLMPRLFGLEVWTPTEDNRCMVAPLPCTPYPHPNLRLRHDGDLKPGLHPHHRRRRPPTAH